MERSPQRYYQMNYNKKPPLKLQLLGAKLPKHAFVVILDGEVQNPEFVAEDMGEGDKSWKFLLQKWKRRVYPQLARSKVEYWEWHCPEWSISQEIRPHGR